MFSNLQPYPNRCYMVRENQESFDMSVVVSLQCSVYIFIYSFKRSTSRKRIVSTECESSPIFKSTLKSSYSRRHHVGCFIPFWSDGKPPRFLTLYVNACHRWSQMYPEWLMP
mmetsp:Transcript_974/g.2035  ORF Transcript_974/g.2035 Transcript_974/m.2035 type:complete len:112 (+) Transcript_974:2000-2335(+)